MENQILEQPLVFTGCSSIQFFSLPPFPKTASQVTPGIKPFTVQHLCELWDAMLLHWSPRISLPTFTCGSKRLLATRRYQLVGSIYVQGLLQNIILSFHLLEHIFKQFHMLPVAYLIHQTIQPFNNLCFTSIFIHKRKSIHPNHQPSQSANILSIY